MAIIVSLPGHSFNEVICVCKENTLWKCKANVIPTDNSFSRMYNKTVIAFSIPKILLPLTQIITLIILVIMVYSLTLPRSDC